MNFVVETWQTVNIAAIGTNKCLIMVYLIVAEAEYTHTRRHTQPHADTRSHTATDARIVVIGHEPAVCSDGVDVYGLIFFLFYS